MDLSELHLNWGACRHNGKVYKSYSLARSYREAGKNRKEIVLKLGKLSDAQAEQWRLVLAAFKNPGSVITSLEDVAVGGNLPYLDLAVVRETWNRWGFDKIFQGLDKRETSLATIAFILVANRCISPESKSEVCAWARGTSLPYLLDVAPSKLNASKIFRELTAIEDRKEDLCEFLFTKISNEDPESLRSVFYDLSSTTFYGCQCVLMKWGHCKEGFQNHIVLALLVNNKGLPLYWEVLPGGTADVSTINWLLDRLANRLKLADLTLVFDRGMVSDENLKSIHAEQIKYISAMDKNQIEPTTGIKFSDFKNLMPEHIGDQLVKMNFTKVNDKTYYQEVKKSSDQPDRRYILCFNPQLFHDERKGRQRDIDKCEVAVRAINEELLTAKKSRTKTATASKFKKALVKNQIKKFAEVQLEEIKLKIESREGSQEVRSYQGKLIVNEVKQLEAGKLDGFWLLVSNHIEETTDGCYKMSAVELIGPYREKVVIESSFRDVKSFVDISPVRVWTKAHVKAHYTLCVLAHLINRALTIALHEASGQLSEGIITHEKLYKALQSCHLNQIKIKNSDMKGYGFTEPSRVQKELLDRLQMKHLLSNTLAKKLGKQVEELGIYEKGDNEGSSV